MNDVTTVYRPASFRRVYVEDVEHLRLVAEELRGGDAVGVDIEMGQRLRRKPGGYQEWIHLLALIQIASDDLSVVVDPLRCDDLTPLQPLMAGRVRKVFLGGGQDVTLLERAGVPVRTIVDVGEVALAVFGRREDGMAALSHRIFGISLDKTVRRTDWLARPLNAGLITYAHRDAELTLLIYRWMQKHQPTALGLHERDEMDPSIARFPPWLREALARPPDVQAILVEHRLDAERDAEKLARAVHAALTGSGAPRLTNRLIRVASELHLRSIRDDVLPLADSPSAFLRASAARGLGQLGTLEQDAPVLERLKADEMEEVRKAAEAALRELAAPATKQESPEAEEETPALDDEAQAALQRLLDEMKEAAPRTAEPSP